MITNDRQYKIAKAQIQSFQSSLDGFSTTSTSYTNVHPLIIEANRHAIEAQLKDLVADVQEYEALKSGAIIVSEVRNLSDLPKILIKARIANGFTQAELAAMLDMPQQQIQRYESELYGATSLKTLLRIAELLKVSIHGDVQLKEISEEIPAHLNANNYPFKEMVKRKFFTGFTGTMNDAVQRSKELLFQLYDRVHSSNLQYSLNRKSIRAGGQTNAYALGAWYAKVVYKAKQQHPICTFDRSTITKEWVYNLTRLSRYDDGPKRAAEYIKQSGMSFVIESQLEGTYLDGAALLLEDKCPIIALTLRHDRLDNFWFTLLHEIGHVDKHLGDEIEAIFDDLDVKSDGIEKEADEFALDAFIPNDIWKKSLVRFSPSEETITNLAEKLHVHPALIAGRIRRETGKYYLFNQMIGNGEVRKHFSEELNH